MCCPPSELVSLDPMEPLQQDLWYRSEGDQQFDLLNIFHQKFDSVVGYHEVCFKNLIKGAGQGLWLTREGSGLRSELKSVVDKSRNLFELCFKVCTGEARDEAACQEASCPVFWWHLSIDFVLSLSIQVFWEDHLSWLCEFIKFTLHHILHWWWCLYFDNGNYLESTLQHVNHWYYLHCL